MADHFRKSGKAPKYADSDKFTYKIHHGGQIIQKGSQQKYIGGEVIFLDWVSADQQSLVECHNIARQLGYHLELSMHRKKPTRIGFVEMTRDIEVLALIDEMGKNRITELFMVDKKNKDVGEGSTNVDVSVEQEVKITNNGDVSFLEDVEGRNWEDTDVEGGQNEEVADKDVFKDSDYEQDSDIELQVDYEVDDDDEFEEHVDQPIREEPEEIGFAGEISDDDANSCDFHNLENETS
ncbi:unnamed protein product [Malus baccata var. baccata]